MSFDFAMTDDSSTTTEDNEAVRTVNPDYEANETGDIYISSGDWKAILGEMLEALDLEALKIYSDDTLEDVSRLLGEYSEAHPQQKLHMVASLLKSTAGKAQRDNDHTIGLVDGKIPEDHDDDGLSNSVDVSYALHHSDLPSINWDDLDGGERESLEEMGIDPSELGFDTNHGGPKLLVIDGQRLPIAVEEGNEVMEALELLQQLPNEPSAYTEDGFRESSDPSVFGDVDTDKVAEESSSDEDNDDEEVDYINNPDQIGEVGANTLRSGKGSVREIDSLRTIQTLLARESDGKARSTVMDALKERRNTLRSDDDEDDTEAAGEEDDTDDEELDLSESEMDLASTLIEAGQAEDLEDAAQQIRSL
jgi:hypothetical protein